MQEKNTCTSTFFNGISKDTPASGEDFIVDYADLSNMMVEALLIIDFQKQIFLHVPNHALLRCGLSPDKVNELGYEFFREALHPKDLPVWVEMHNIILNSLCNGKLQAERINYFACTFRIKSFLQTAEQPDYLMVYLKLKPKWINEKLRFGICLLSHAVVSKAGNLCVYYQDLDHAEYSFATKRWTHHPFTPLTKRQKEMLVWAQQGLTQKEMADKMHVCVKTIEGIRYSLFQKFGVASIEQAIQFATNRRLIHHTPFATPDAATIKKKRAKDSR